MSETLKIIVPATPPSGNNYTRARCAPMGGKMMPLFYHTKEAKAWWKIVAQFAHGRSVDSGLYTVAFVLHLPPRSRMDLDNGSKCILDSLTKAGVIRDDRYVTELHAYKVKAATDADARTEIYIRPLGQMSLLGPAMPSASDWDF